MMTLLRCTFASLIGALMVGAPWWYQANHEKHYRNFHVVSAGKLYRSGQLDLEGLQQVVHRYGIKTIVCLRDADSALSQNEESWARAHALNFVRIPQRPWRGLDATVPAEQGLSGFRAVMNEPAHYPVLVHCFAGVHRTGAYCAVYRMDYDGWSNRAALAEMRLMGYQTLGDDRDILGYLASYRPRAEHITTQFDRDP
jgi:tyrosine-protein phosphatase SIW14